MRTNPFELSFVLLCSLLLGIWATVHTIALRNVLLVFGTVFAVILWRSMCRTDASFPADKKPQRWSLVDWIPLGLIGILFIWAVVHFFLFSQDPVTQWHELKSTWLRSLMALIVGSGLGLVLQRQKNYLLYLWLGLIVSFVVLIAQYIPKAIDNRSLFAIDWLGDYIYWAKFNGVLAGSLLLAGLFGLSIDYFSKETQSLKTPENSNDVPQLASTPAVWSYVVLGALLAIYSFVFVFDAKAGIGMTLILLGAWFVLQIFLHQKRLLSPRYYIPIVVLLLVVTWAATKHMKNNPGWESLFSDIAVSAQIDRHQHWKNINQYGFPIKEDGQAVKGNVYERVSYALLGLRAIADNPLGYGVFRSFPEQMRAKGVGYEGETPYTHSAWIDFGLAYGIPGLIFLPCALLMILFKTMARKELPNRATIALLACAVLILYTVGEYGFKHGIEILFFMMSFLAITSIPLKSNNG